MVFTRGEGDWERYRERPSLVELDFRRHDSGGAGLVSYAERMAQVYRDALAALRDAHGRGVRWVLFAHGAPAPGPTGMTSRSVVRRLMRSKEATPYIDRRQCVQHAAAFLAAIRPGVVPA